MQYNCHCSTLLHRVIITLSVSNYSHRKSMILLLPNQRLTLARELVEGEHLTFATVLSPEQLYSYLKMPFIYPAAIPANLYFEFHHICILRWEFNTSHFFFLTLQGSQKQLPSSIIFVIIIVAIAIKHNSSKSPPSLVLLPLMPPPVLG